MTYAAAFEWFGCLAGLVGATLLAANTRVSRYGWIAFAVANIAMIAMALLNGLHGLLIQQIGFTATCALGLYRAGFFQASRPHENHSTPS